MLTRSRILSVFLIAISSLFFLVSNCKPTPPAPVAPPSAPSGSETAAKPSDMSIWEQTVKQAKKEGRLTVYSTAPGEIRQALQASFKEQFGFSPEVISVRGGEMGQKLLTERRAGLYLVDVYMGGSTTPITQLKPVGVLDSLDSSLILPEVKDTSKWLENKLWWIDEDKTVLMFLGFPVPNLGLNINLTSKEEIKSYRDLLSPKFKGKIIMNDPTLAGTAAKGFSVIGFHLMNLDYWREIAKQEPTIIRDQRQQVEWLSQGKFSVLFFPQSAVITDFIRAGAPVVSHTPVEGTYVTGASGNITLVNKAPHPAAAKVFINWVLSKDGQTAFSQAFGRQSLRLDVTTEGLDPVAIRQPGGKYFTGSENEEFLSKQPEQMQVAAEIFAKYLK